MRRRAASLLAVTVLATVPCLISAQPSTFEVASVKPNPSRTGIRDHRFPGDRFEAHNVPLRDLIILAYGEAGQALPDARLAGGPGWIDVDRFDIIARVGSGGQTSVAQKQRMLQTLLAERFKLAVHTESRELPIYALIAKTSGALGSQLRHADVDCEALLAAQPGGRERCVLSAPPSGVLTVRGQTMGAIAYVLTVLLDRVVIDRTGLTGGFDADARFNPELLPGMAPTPRGVSDEYPSLDTALQEQLGLKLESTRAPVDVLVIDRVEPPTPD